MRKVFVPLLLLLVIDQIGITVVLPILAPLFYQLQNGIFAVHVSEISRDVLYGFTLALFPLFIFIGAPILGDISDQVGRKKALLLCLFATAVSFLLSALAITLHSISLLLVSRALAGFFCAAQFIAQAAINDISPPEKRALNLSLTVLAIGIGVVLGPIIGGYFSRFHMFPGLSYQLPFILTAGLAFINILLLWAWFQETYAKPKMIRLNIYKGFLMFFMAFKNIKMRQLSFVFIAYQFGWGLFIQFISLFLMQKLHFSVFKLGGYYAYLGFCMSVALLLIFRGLTKIIENKTILLISFCSVLFGAFFILLFPYEWSLWSFSFFMASGGAMAYPVMLAMFANAVDTRSQGWMMGVAGALMAFDWTISGLFIGPLIYINLMLPFFCILAAFAAAIVLFKIPHKRYFPH